MVESMGIPHWHENERDILHRIDAIATGKNNTKTSSFCLCKTHNAIKPKKSVLYTIAI